MNEQKSERDGRLTLVVLAICGAYGINPDRLDYAVNKVSYEMICAPKGKKQAAGHRAARRILAKQLHLPESRIPILRIHAKSISKYETYRATREKWDMETSGSWVANFDYQSRRFAIENQICPRCSMPAKFTEEGGVCNCGFSI